MKIHHISDLHIKRSRNQKIEECLRELRLNMPYGDRVMLTGDITNNGTRFEYREAKRLLMPFAGFICVAPGNHDYGVLGNTYQYCAARRFKQLQAQLSGNNTRNVIILDSCKRTHWIGDFARGNVGYWQRQWLKLKLAQASRPPIVLLHHDPDESNNTLRLEDADKLIKICDGKAAMVLYGHTHKARIRFTKLGTMFSAADDFDDAGKAKVYEWKMN